MKSIHTFFFSMNSKFFQQLKTIQVISYDSNFKEESPLGIRQILSDMEKWLKKFEAGSEFEDGYDGTNWSLLPQGRLKIY